MSGFIGSGKGVTSVNGQTGPAVVLTAADVSAAGLIANTFSGSQSIANTEPRVIFNETDQGSDAKIWDLDVSAGVFTLRTRTDSDGNGRNALAVTRNGIAITTLDFGNVVDNPNFNFLGTGNFIVNGTFIAADINTGNVNAFVNLNAVNVGTGLRIKEGANAKMGVAVLIGGTATVANTSVTANSRIFLTAQSLDTVTVGQGLGVSARIPGTSFTILSGSAIDTSTVAWMMVEPVP